MGAGNVPHRGKKRGAKIHSQQASFIGVTYCGMDGRDGREKAKGS